ncbi:MAG: Hsp70 family protein, partial [Myxococcales bacterium]|nr:Hsp70 family protein [Myxococcales bacterium]
EGAVPAVPGFAPPVHALCVAPFGLEEGAAHAELAQPFGLVVGEAVRFRFFASSTRRDDGVGTRLTEWAPGELDELNGIEVTLPADGRGAGDVVPVRFRSRVNETGTLELEAVAVGSDESWKIRFDLRSGTGA